MGPSSSKQPRPFSLKPARGRRTGGPRSKCHSPGRRPRSWLASSAPSGRYRLAPQGRGQRRGRPQRWYALRQAWRRRGGGTRSRGWARVLIAPSAGTQFSSAPSRAQEQGCGRRGPVTSPSQSPSPYRRLSRQATQQGVTGESTVGRPLSTWNWEPAPSFRGWPEAGSSVASRAPEAPRAPLEPTPRPCCAGRRSWLGWRRPTLPSTRLGWRSLGGRARAWAVCSGACPGRPLHFFTRYRRPRQQVSRTSSA